MYKTLTKSHTFSEVKNVSTCSDFEIYGMPAASYANFRVEMNQGKLLNCFPMLVPHCVVDFSAFFWFQT